MTPENNDLLDAEFVQDAKINRRNLLPTWIKVFTWFFMIAGVLIPFSLIAAFLGFRYEISIYGISSYGFSAFTLGTAGIFVLKGITAFGLWFKKEWAVKLAIIDAIIGIVICGMVMLVLPVFFSSSSGFSFNIRLELLILFPYLLTMLRIKKTWEENCD